MRPLILRASTDQRRRSSLTLQPDQLSHLTRVAESAASNTSPSATRRRGSLNRDQARSNSMHDLLSLRNTSPGGGGGSPGGGGGAIAGSPSVSSLRRGPSPLTREKHKAHRKDSTNLEVQTSSIVWIGVIFVVLIVVITAGSVLLRSKMVF